MVIFLFFNDIMKDANLVHENSLDVLFGPLTTTIDFHVTIGNSNLRMCRMTKHIDIKFKKTKQ